MVTGPQAYISPSWYPSKHELGKVVPTWNDSDVQLTGRAQVHEDPDWIRPTLDDLVERYEAHRPQPWSSDDAPANYIIRQLHAIVGIEVRVERVEAKAKLSQNRSYADRAGVVRGLRQERTQDADRVAEQMASTRNF